jgi:hypothetical protein
MFTQILNLGNNILDKLFPDKAERDQAKLKLIELEQAGELSELETRMSAIIAEAKSSDPWTSRARPSFMYVIYIFILMAIPVGVLSAFKPETAILIANGCQSWLNSIPDGLWATFGIGYAGYSVARSYDKSQILKK